LDLIGIAHCGAGKNQDQARRPAVLEANGRRFAFLAYTEKMWSVDPAGAKPGTVLLNEDEAVADIRKARETADFVLVSLHWGEEHRGLPRDSDRVRARSLLDAGADAVIGHHPHVLQGAEFYKGKPIVYSLGNFVFDMISSRTYESAAAVFVFGPAGPQEVRFVPLRIDTESFAPAPAEGADARKIGALLSERCAAVGSRLEALEDGTFLLRPQGAYRTIADAPPTPQANRVSGSLR
jgi:poly-gamma-glutamate synthesis protein (capsule biosynthesis protein)